jgi:cellulose synthase/poly-beta-1,6-N-acetylglucosamine synthase-like glycosyltransferase
MNRHQSYGTAPFISIVIPCRNEQKFIGVCLDSVIANDYPRDLLEVLVVDGMSEDNTRTIIQTYARRYPFIRLLDNPKKITPAALNTGIRHAKGNVIVRMDAHARIGKDYVARSVECLLKHEADNVGGVMITEPREQTLVGRAIVAGLSHRFGVGGSYFRIHTDGLRWVDTVFGGCYRKEIFDQIGQFNERLARGQDMELNRRLKKAGGRILLVPDIVSHYYARSDLKSFWFHNWNNGVWAILPFAYSSVMPVSWRHLVPLAFVTSLLGSAVLSLLETSFQWLWMVIAIAYGAANLGASLHIAWRERDLRYFLVMPLVFAILHIGYGFGSLWGLVKLVGRPEFWKKVFDAEANPTTPP